MNPFRQHYGTPWLYSLEQNKQESRQPQDMEHRKQLAVRAAKDEVEKNTNTIHQKAVKTLINS